MTLKTIVYFLWSSDEDSYYMNHITWIINKGLIQYVGRESVIYWDLPITLCTCDINSHGYAPK